MAASIENLSLASDSRVQVEEVSPAIKEGVKRQHDLDALRAIAMLIGIVLHASLSFAPIPWVVNDVQQSSAYVFLFSAIHGFRMPLFFLISGYFTAMLWRKRGLRGLVLQRAKRILLPLILGCMTIVPAMFAVSSLASRPKPQTDAVDHFALAETGDSETLKSAIQSKAIAVDALHPNSGASLLTVATFCGHPDTVEMLLNQGADPNQKNGDAGTPLHVAVFMGRVDSTKLLLAAGANPETLDGTGNTPKDNLKIDFGTTNYIAQLYGQTLVEKELEDGRAQIAEMLGDKIVVEETSKLAGLYGLLFQFPAFMHLWFLAFLCWLVIAFCGYAVVARWISFESLPKGFFCSPLSLIWLVPLTMLPQLFMMTGVYGADTSVGLLPIPSVLAYYAIFFFFGAIYWDLGDHEQALGRKWYFMLPVALLVVFPIGLELVSGTFGILSDEVREANELLVGSFFESLFAWMMIFASIGMFRSLFSNASPTMRYISDSSYWLYLVHLPLVILAQWFVRDWPVPSWLKFAGIVIVVSAFLLLTYEYMVRYTIIGRMLNGPKKRSHVPAET